MGESLLIWIAGFRDGAPMSAQGTNASSKRFAKMLWGGRSDVVYPLYDPTSLLIRSFNGWKSSSPGYLA